MASDGAAAVASENGSCSAANKPLPEEAAVVVTFKPQLLVPAQKTDEAVLFYKAAFGAEELRREAYPKRKADEQSPRIVCAELEIGGTSLIICDQTYDSLDDGRVPLKEKVVGTGRMVLRLEASDVQAAIEKAVKAGAVEEKGEAAEEGQYCDVVAAAMVKDPFGYMWAIVSAYKDSDEAAFA